MGKPFGCFLDFVGKILDCSLKLISLQKSRKGLASTCFSFNFLQLCNCITMTMMVILWFFWIPVMYKIYIYTVIYMCVCIYTYTMYRFLFHDQAWLAWRRLRVFLWLSVVGEASAECPWFWVFDVVICQAGITNIASSCSDVLVYICICLQTYACMCIHVCCLITCYIPYIYICMYLLHVF